VKKIVVLASGSGSNFQAIIDAVNRGEIDAQIAGLIAGKPGIGSIDRASRHHIPFKTLTATTESELSTELLSLFNNWKPDLIILAGFLKKIPVDVVSEYRNKIINIHPSLLPKYGGKGFYGERVHRAVIDSGDNVSGCTVHFVNEHYDDGDIIRQSEVSVLDTDTPETLAKRVLAEEHKLLPAVTQTLLTSNQKN
jgi:phosphoribosylglycinamide formyltransferase 1